MKNKIFELAANLLGQQNTLVINTFLIDKTKSIEGSLLLSQLLYWSDRTRIPGGWIAKTYEQWYDEIRLSKKQISRLSSEFRKLGILETIVKKFNGVPTLHYKLNQEKIIEWFTEPIPENPKSDNQKPDKSSITLNTSTNNEIGKCETKNGKLPQGTIDSDLRELSKVTSGNYPLTEPTTEPTTENTKGKSDSLNRGTSLSENFKNCSNKVDIEESLKVADEVPNRNQSSLSAQSNLEEGTTRAAPIDAPEPVTDAAPKKTDSETFEEFWNHWHNLSGQPKTDKKESFGVWKELSLEDKRKAYRNTKLFIDNMLDSYKDSTFIKKAKNYLADQNFNDEFGKPQSKEGVLKGNFFDKKGQRELNFISPYAAR